MPGLVTRHFITLSGGRAPRQVHYRRAGSGPLVLMLHQSPQSSREMVPLMRAWSDRFTLVAPDSPGYGWSDPLSGEDLSLDDFADATLEFADAIGATRFGIYGYHTGCSIGLLLAARHPGRISAVAGNGLILPTDAERSDLLERYLPPLVPRWDGSHLAWAWARLREQAIYFPWYARGATTRLDYDLPPAERLQVALQDFLAAGEHYACAYRGAFACRAGEALARLRVPFLVTAAPRDPLAAHLVRIAGAPDCVTAAAAHDPEDAWVRCRQHLIEHPGEPISAPPDTAPVPGRSWRRMLAIAGGRQLCCLHRGTAGDQPLLLLHGAGRSARALLSAMPALPGRELVVPDLPGHGASDGWESLPDRLLDETVTALHAALDSAGLSDAPLAGSEGGGLLALALSARLGRRQPPVLVNPPLWTAGDRAEWLDRGLPSLAPQWHGGHLLEAWHMLRDGRLFHPWFQRERPAIRRGEPDLDERRLQADLVEYRWEDAALPDAERLLVVDAGLGAGQQRFRPVPAHRLLSPDQVSAAWQRLPAG